MSDNPNLSTQNVLDALKLLDQDLIDKVLAISKLVTIENLADGTVRISLDLVPKR